MSLKFNIFVFALFCVQCIHSEKDVGYYTIVGPKIIRANSKYHVSVNSQGLKEAITLKIGVEESTPGTGYEAFKYVLLEPHTTQRVSLEIGNITTGNYKLFAEGLSGLYLKKVEVGLNAKMVSIFIQTDKAIYKPEDTVKFRVLILDSNLKPAIIQDSVDVYIQDAQVNRIKQWNNVVTNKGVFSGEMKLSSAPILGSWLINVRTVGAEYVKNFDVDEYVLPKFEVSVDAPRHASLKDGKISAIIRSKYTYGKFVKGELTVSAYATSSVGSLQHNNKLIIPRKVMPIDGKAIAEFNIVTDLGLPIDGSECDLIIEAIVEETLTGLKQNTTAIVTLHKSKYKIEILPDMKKYVPGLPYVGWVKVTYHDGAPVQDKVHVIEIEHKYIRDIGSRTVEHLLNDNGMAPFKFKTEKLARDAVTITVNYLDVTEKLEVNKREAENNVYIQTKLNTENPMVNQEIEIEVTGTEDLKYFTYQVIGRGDIIETNTIQVPNNTRTYSFKFTSTFAMVPKAKVLVYFIHTDGFIVFDSTIVEFPTIFQNTVKIALSTSQAKPGENLDLTITAKPNSFVGLLGVDQSVLLLKKGNDLEKSDLFAELEKYQVKSPSIAPSYPGQWQGTQPHGPPMYYPTHGLHPSSYPSYNHPSESSIFPDFEDIQTVILTNAKSNHRAPQGQYYGPGSAGGYYSAPPSYSSPQYGMAMQSVPMRGTPGMHPGMSGMYPGPPISYMSSAGPQISREITVSIRKEFPETWIYDNIEDNGNEGKTTIHKKVPDTITSWVITGFAIDVNNGFGMTQTPRKLKVFQPFFVSTNLPYSIKRGEIIAIPITVFNYMNEDVDAEVKLDNELHEFEFADISNEINETPKVEAGRVKIVRVKANNGASVSFMVKPTRTGHITIKVTAMCPSAGDIVEKTLLVVPEGIPQYVNKAVFIDLRDQPEFNEDVEIDIPKKSVPESTRIEFSAVGDLLGPTIKNLEKLIRLPTGCGEQNMMKFVPNILILDYLNVTNQLTDEIKDKSIKYMETGYQRALTYMHDDGSFSAWGKSDSSGSTWLTAFVAQSFEKASKYIHIDDTIIMNALQWLSNTQLPNGNFPEVGRVIQKEIQGGSGEGIALTAYTLITFLENNNGGDYNRTIQKAVDYIVRKIDELDDVYSLSIVSYALQLTGHPLKGSVLEMLQSRASSENGKTYWLKPAVRQKITRPIYFRPNSLDIEVSSYALLAYMKAGLVTDSLPIMKWLVSQRNERGGFQSTQDTVMGLKALSTIAAHITSKNNNVHISAEYIENQVATLHVNHDNAMVLQSRELPASLRQVKIKATGQGFAMAQISYKYHVNVTIARPRFNLEPQIQSNSNKNYLQLTVCTSYIPIGNDTNSNMVVMEVAFPSGFTADIDKLPSLRASHSVKRVETKDADSIVVMYFNTLDRTEVCPTITAFRTHKVAHQKPAAVVIYDYYDTSFEARKFYQIQDASLCDICDDDDCTESCRSVTK